MVKRCDFRGCLHDTNKQTKMKTLAYVILTFTTTAIIAARYGNHKKATELKSENIILDYKIEKTAQKPAQCPAAYDVRSTEDPGEFGKEYISEGPKYTHCKKCDIGVFMDHAGESKKTCTYCGQPQPAELKDN
jgi:hypothetical protein